MQKYILPNGMKVIYHKKEGNSVVLQVIGVSSVVGVCNK